LWGFYGARIEITFKCDDFSLLISLKMTLSGSVPQKKGRAEEKQQSASSSD
jgi:hypothetical protein